MKGRKKRAPKPPSHRDRMMLAVKLAETEPKVALALAEQSFKEAAREYLRAIESDTEHPNVEEAVDLLKQTAVFWAQTEVIYRKAVVTEVMGHLTEVLCDPDVHLGEDK
jgi:ferric iron reductase protein FhuF